MATIKIEKIENVVLNLTMEEAQFLKDVLGWSRGGLNYSNVVELKDHIYCELYSKFPRIVYYFDSWSLDRR